MNIKNDIQDVLADASKSSQHKLETIEAMAKSSWHDALSHPLFVGLAGVAIGIAVGALL